ncbi:Speckle-type POZ protein B-like protein [Aphelenchoides besseyi]|nr:Speckle-type POZ protein B-like protein [Aphelenchoides besseyi]KAI6212123.1 Speckle-type POZ protein B-like protein [Aphelenchoides besseyi]
MASIFASDHSNVAVWRIDDFAAKYQQSIDGDWMSSEPFAFEHPEFGKIEFYLEITPKVKSRPNSVSLFMQITAAPSVFSISMDCSVWIKTEDKKCSEAGSEALSFNNKNACHGWSTFLYYEEKSKFIHASTVFICFQLPYPMKSIGSVSTNNTHYQWTISDFESRFKSAQFKTSWQSDTFTVPEYKDVKFALLFYPKGDNEEYKNECALYLVIKDLAGHSKVSVQCNLWIKNSKLRLRKISFNRAYTTVSGYGFSGYVNQEHLYAFAQNEPFDVCCNVRPIIETTSCFHCVSSRSELGSFFNNPLFADAEIHVEDKVFKVSRLMVSIKSPVFRAMFDKETQEQKSGVVTIKDFEAEMVEKMLIYIYKGEVADLEEVAVQLLPVADCYQVNDLVKKCYDSILSNLTAEIALPILELAVERDHLKDFQDRVFKFAHKNYSAIRKLDYCEEFMIEHPKIAVKLLNIFGSSN